MSDENERLNLEGLNLYPKQAAFLAAFAETGHVTRSARIVDVARTTVYEWLKDPEFARAYAEAEGMAVRNLEDEAYRRAHDGLRKAVFYKGKQVEVFNPETGHMEPYWEHEYSDTLMVLLLKSHKPERYRDRSTTAVELTGKDGEPVELSIVPALAEHLASLRSRARATDPQPRALVSGPEASDDNSPTGTTET